MRSGVIEMTRDIVCGMGVEEDDPCTFSKLFEGTIYYFCSEACMLLFMKDPFDYINPEGKDTIMTKDLICGMDVDENNPPFTTVYMGKTYYFCCNACKREFEREPEKYKRKEIKCNQ